MAAPDPLEALRLEAAPVEPRPEFAEALRRRIEAALQRGGQTVSEVGYITIEVPDAERARTSSASVAWTVRPRVAATSRTGRAST